MSAAATWCTAPHWGIVVRVSYPVMLEQVGVSSQVSLIGWVIHGWVISVMLLWLTCLPWASWRPGVLAVTRIGRCYSCCMGRPAVKDRPGTVRGTARVAIHAMTSVLTSMLFSNSVR